MSAHTKKPVLTGLAGQYTIHCAYRSIVCKFGLPEEPEEQQVKRQLKKLSLLSEHRLNSYTVAATAAGIGTLCFGQAAQAKIVYTPANVRIVRNMGLVRFDLNHDGISDFGLSNTRTRPSSSYIANLKVVPQGQANQVWWVYSTSSGSNVLCAAALPKGTKVGPKRPFQHGSRNGMYMAHAGRIAFGPWLRDVTAYLGLKFVVQGKTHFGWARVKVSDIIIGRPLITATLTGYAYETIPGKPIIAGATKGPDGETGGLGALAAGVAGR